MPKILILSRHTESASFRLRIQAYLDVLRQTGIESDVEKLPSGFWSRIRLLRRANRYDGVVLHKKRLNSFEAFWLRRWANFIIYDFDDAVMYDSENPDKASPRRQKCFEQTVKMADWVITDNSLLAGQARKFCKNVEVIPTGLDINSYRVCETEKRDGKIRLVWIGGSSTLGFLADIKESLEQIGSQFNNVVLRIISNEFFDLKNMKVEKCQWSLENQISDLAASDIGLVPMPDNKFTQNKFGFKMLQYAAVGLPIIASPVGANGDFLKPNHNGLFASGCSDWVKKMTQLIEDAQLRKQLGLRARADLECFDVGVIGKRLTELVSNCIKTTDKA
ncbi:MAG: glycosyltransferase family 4 protein [Phycisphaerae bacterium]|nr:glycosyltransferase family 4 protein [Phycisphaerae bacterium]